VDGTVAGLGPCLRLLEALLAEFDDSGWVAVHEVVQRVGQVRLTQQLQPRRQVLPRARVTPIGQDR
jgi:hypothetical protein